MQFDSDFRPERPVPALIGNGTFVTFLGKTGFHEGAGDWSKESASTQEFVLAGRRHPGPHYRLLSFGILKRELWVEGAEPTPIESSSSIHTDISEVRVRKLYETVLESTRSLILAHKNCFLSETRLSNHSPNDVSILWTLRLRKGERPPQFTSSEMARGKLKLQFETQDNLGEINLSASGAEWVYDDDHAVLTLRRTLEPGDEAVVRVAISISDRLEFQLPFDLNKWESEVNQHADEWREFWSESEIETGDENVDQFREIALYTIRCQTTPWSIPPSISEMYWSAGAFHDEFYPFLGLLTAGHRKFSSRIPNFRLLTLEKAIKRAVGNGALYPWSSTESGEERDPHGHWYSERFHLGQIALSAWTIWLADRRLDTLEVVYPILRETARYFETEMLERDERGNLFTKSCTDFDESVGAVRGGPMTMAAAWFCLDRANEAARRLGVDRERRAKWEALSQELRRNFAVDLDRKIYAVPEGKDFHISTLGFVVPFCCDEGSEFAQNTAQLAHQKFKSENGFRPGLNSFFDGSAWMWTAGHLAMVHAVLGDANLAWEAIKKGIDSTGQFMSPNEHLDRYGIPVVPWFTTGCGAWLAGFHQMFARFSDDGDFLLGAVPESLTNFSFRGLALSRNVSASAKILNGKLTFLSLLSEYAITFEFDTPMRFVEEVWPNTLGRITDLGSSWRIQVDLMPGENRLLG